MASSISKSLRLASKIPEELCKINEYVASILHDYEEKNNESFLYPTLSQLLNINAGLTRFSSQTFSGITNILETDCHLAHHSLLGIGTANLALINIRHFIQNTLGSARIPERFSLYKNQPATRGLNLLNNDDSIWTADNLGKTNLKHENCEPQVPLISYFSTRDGFKSTLTTISAPLTTFSACNALQWSLLTITHELTHIIVRSIISEIYPDFNSKSDMKKLWNLIAETISPENLLEDIRRFLVYAIMKMDQVAHNPEQEETTLNDENDLRDILENWNREVEEIVVHIFDYLYFYGSDIDKYIQGIWITWGTIPNLTNRLKEYVVRTLCVSLTNHLRRSNAEDIARKQVIASLQKIKENKIGSSEYIDQAILYLKESWKTEIRPKLLARKLLIKFTKSFLYSESIAASVRGETEITGKTGEREGYSLSPGYIEATEIRNPLRFIELYTTSYKPSLVESFWMINILAFSIKQEDVI